MSNCIIRKGENEKSLESRTSKRKAKKTHRTKNFFSRAAAKRSTHIQRILVTKYACEWEKTWGKKKNVKVQLRIYQPK